MILRDENIFKTIIPFVNNIVDFDYPYVDTVADVEAFDYNEFIDMIKELDFSHYSINTIVDPSKKENYE